MSTENLTEFSSRIKTVRKTTGLNKGDFAKSLNVSGAYIGQLESGAKTNPSALFLNSVEKVYGVNRLWLESGVGEMKAVRLYMSAEDHDVFCKKESPDPVTAKINSILVSMTDKQRRDVLKYCEMQLSYEKMKKAGQDGCI